MIATDIIEVASKAGTLPLQVLLIAALLILGRMFVRYHAETILRQKDIIDKMDAREEAMSQERRDRITMLMGLMKDEVAVNQKLVGAVDNNTKAISELRTFISEQVIITRDLIKNNQGKRK